MKYEDIIKATRNSLNIYSFTAEALEKLISAIQSEHKYHTCEALARTVMMDQTAHDAYPAAQRQWVGLSEQEVWDAVRDTVGIMPSKAFRVYQAIETVLKKKNT